MGHGNDIRKSGFVNGSKNGSFKAAAVPADPHAHVFAMMRMVAAGAVADNKDVNIVRGQKDDPRYAGFIVNQGFPLIEPSGPAQSFTRSAPALT